MRVGLALDLGSDPAAGPVARQVRTAEPLLRAAEAAGFDSVWLGESYHPEPEPFHLPSPLLVLAHLAARTTLGLGTGVLLARAHHPDRLAVEAALLDQLSDGRLTLGVGLGGDALRGALGGPDLPGGRVLDGLLVRLRELWRRPAVVPGPHRPGGPPVLVGGRGQAAIRRAVELGDGWYGATNHSDRLVAAQAAAYRAAGGAGDVAVNRLCIVGPDAGPADRYLDRVVGYYRSRGAWDIGRADGDPEPLLVGGVDAVRGGLERLRDAGVTQVQLRVAPLGVPGEVALRTVDAIGEHVLPAFA
jgi:alkanesulfonate monooxygenase SsuD/methylene tetrahydromethanopterin reductase-like flavin-dependent oxidoreductase (luciferase family)